MKKAIITTFVLLVVVIGIIYMFGFFPVARINGEFVLYRSYSNRASALLLFEEQSRKASDGGDVTPDVADGIRQSVLQNLISEMIFRQYIAEQPSLSGLTEKADKIVADTLTKANPEVLPRATEQLYGWSVEEFTENVLFPQALQNELAEEIKKGGTPFEGFARTKLTEANVTLYLVPWKWENGDLVGK